MIKLIDKIKLAFTEKKELLSEIKKIKQFANYLYNMLTDKQILDLQLHIDEESYLSNFDSMHKIDTTGTVFTHIKDNENRRSFGTVFLYVVLENVNRECGEKYCVKIGDLSYSFSCYFYTETKANEYMKRVKELCNII